MTTFCALIVEKTIKLVFRRLDVFDLGPGMEARVPPDDQQPIRFGDFVGAGAAILLKMVQRLLRVGLGHWMAFQPE